MTNDTIREKKYDAWHETYNWSDAASCSQDDVAEDAFMAGYQAASTRNDAPIDKWIKEFELSALPAEDYSPRYKVVGINRIRELIHHLFEAAKVGHGGGKTFEEWYGENVSPCFADEHQGAYHDAHAVFGSDVKAAWDYVMSTKQESNTPKPEPQTSREDELVKRIKELEQEIIELHSK